MKKILTAFLISLGVLLYPNVAKSALLMITGTNNFTTGANNDFQSNWFGYRNLGAPVTISTTQPNVQLTFELIFREAGLNNVFVWAGSNPFMFNGSSIPNMTLPTSFPTQTVTVSSPGPLPFYFLSGLDYTSQVNNNQSHVVSGGNTFSFFASIYDPLQNSGPYPPFPSGTTSNVIYLSFDDGWIGAFPDFDYDDLVIRITATQVNNIDEPPSIASVIVSLFLLYLIYRLFSRRNPA